VLLGSAYLMSCCVSDGEAREERAQLGEDAVERAGDDANDGVDEATENGLYCRFRGLMVSGSDG